MGRDYVPALGLRALTPLYDRVVGLTTRERTVKQALVAQADLLPGLRVLDLACGTGTLSLMADAACPGLQLTGLDGDPEMLARARRKADERQVPLVLDEGLADALPYADGTFDRVLCSLFFHHLDEPTKAAAAAEARRVLAPGGQLHVADWGAPANPLMRVGYLGIQLLDGWSNTDHNRRGLLPGLLRDAGFLDVRERAAFDTVFGTLRLLSARTPQG